MSVKKQILSLCKLQSFYEEIPEEFLDETDVDFYHNIFHICQSQHRTVRVSRSSNKKSFAIRFFQICILKTQQRYILQEVVIISKRKLICLGDNLRYLSKPLIKLGNAHRFPCRNPRLRLDLQSQKTVSLFITITITLNIQIDKFV